MLKKVIFVLLCIFFAVKSVCPFSKTKGGCPLSTNKETTEDGCTCSSPCAASVLDDYARCDRCPTLNRCGKWTFFSGYYDYCVYPVNSLYESKTAQEKLDYIWNKIKENNAPGSHQNILNLLQMSVQTTFDTQWDELPNGRGKIIHAVGAVCKFSFQSSPNSPYTGLWAANSRSVGVIRLGSASAVTTSSGMTPGIGIKFLRSRVKSANFVALFTLDPLPNNSYNFFERDLSNKIPPASGFIEVLVKKFEQASQCPFRVGLSDVCSFTSEGERVLRPVFPYKVVFKSPVIQFPSNPMTESELLTRFNSIPVGTRLYDVYAFGSPSESRENKGTLLGSVVTTSECVSSKYGDEKLFFRHQRVEEDWRLRPEWLREITPKECGQSQLTLNPPKSCPTK